MYHMHHFRAGHCFSWSEAPPTAHAAVDQALANNKAMLESSCQI